GIAPTLVIARVAAGDARPNQTWNDVRPGPVLSFLRFNKTLDDHMDDRDAPPNELGTVSTRTHVQSEHGARAYGDDLETSALHAGSRTSWEMRLQKQKESIE
ncbi:hypothetical protein H0H93_015428, partial [Arthromyces matolae]